MKKYKFSELFDYLPKSKIKAGEGSEKGLYPLFTSSPKLTKYFDKYIYEGESLIFGTGGLPSIHYINEKFSTSTDCLIVQKKKEYKKKVDTGYVYYFFKGSPWILEDGFHGAGLKHISKKYISNIKIPLPENLDDQIKIANLLTQVETLIAKRKKSIKLLDELLKSTFLDMFGDPILNPKGWDKRKIGSIFKVKHGFAFKSEFFEDEGKYVLLTPGNFFENGGYKNRGKKQKYYLGEIPSDYILEKNDILVAMTEQAPGLLGSPLIVPESDSFLHNQRLGLICPHEPIQVDFLFHLFNQKSIRQIIHSKATGTKVRHTSPSKIEDIFIGYPPKPLQDKFATIVQQVETTKSHYQDSLDELNELFGSLSQRAFRGELDLSKMEVEESIEHSSSAFLREAQKEVLNQVDTAKKLDVKTSLNGYNTPGEVLNKLIEELNAKKKIEPKKDIEKSLLQLLDKNTSLNTKEKGNLIAGFTFEEIRDKLFELLDSKKITQTFVYEPHEEKSKEIAYIGLQKQ